MGSTGSNEDTVMPGMILSNPQRELVQDAVQAQVFQELPEQVTEDHREKIGVFAAPGIRALTYVIVDGEAWPKTSEFRDYITFQSPDATGRVDVRPVGEPASVAWRPDAGETDANVQLDLHKHTPGTETTFLATPSDADIETPHLLFGWHNIPEETDQK